LRLTSQSPDNLTTCWHPCTIVQSSHDIGNRGLL